MLCRKSLLLALLIAITAVSQTKGSFNSAAVKAWDMQLTTVGDHIFAVTPRTIVSGLLAREGDKNVQPSLEDCARSCSRLDMCNVFNYCGQDLCRVGLDLQLSAVGACELRFQRELAEGLGAFQLASGGPTMGAAGIEVWVNLSMPIPAGYEHFPATSFFGEQELQCQDTLVPNACAIQGSVEEAAARCDAWSSCQGFTYFTPQMETDDESPPTAFLKGTGDGTPLNPGQGRIHPSATSFVKFGQVEMVPETDLETGKKAAGTQELTAAEIAGIVLGTAFGTLMVAATLFIAVKRYRRSSRDSQQLCQRQLPAAGVGEEHTKDVEKIVAPVTGPHLWSKILGCAKVAGGRAGIDEAASDPESSGSSTAALAAQLFGSAPNPQWQDVLVKPSDIEFCTASNGKRIRLGGGASGSVYCVVLHRHTICACKVFDFGSAASLPKYFVKEASILRNISHPNVVQFCGVSVEEGRGLLLMELMGGIDLGHAMHAADPGGRGGRLYSWYNRGHAAALQVASGLAYLHQRKIVHMDLKPRNILLSRDGTAKIGDVGFSRLMRGNQVSNLSEGRRGTFEWCAPEVLLGDHACEKADIYSFGVILAEMITGQEVLRGRMPTLVAPAECPEEIAALQARCVVSNPAERPSAAEIVAVLGGAARTFPSPSCYPPNTIAGSHTGCDGSERSVDAHETGDAEQGLQLPSLKQLQGWSLS